MVAVELNTRAPRCLWTAARRLALNASAIDSPRAAAHSAADLRGWWANGDHDEGRPDVADARRQGRT